MTRTNSFSNLDRKQINAEVIEVDWGALFVVCYYLVLFGLVDFQACTHSPWVVNCGILYPIVISDVHI